MLQDFELIAGEWPVKDAPCKLILITSSLEAVNLSKCDPSAIVVCAAIKAIVPLVPKSVVLSICRAHKIRYDFEKSCEINAGAICRLHKCSEECSSLVYVFHPIEVNVANDNDLARDTVPYESVSNTPSFPPALKSPLEIAEFVDEWADAIAPENILESACAVCARLTLMRDLQHVCDDSIDLSPLSRPGEGVTRRERMSDADPIEELPGPVLYPGGIRSIGGKRLIALCSSCVHVLKRGKLPRYALANGRWIGQIPMHLPDLSYVEQLMIARYRHSYCVAQVASGQHYLAANVIVFGQPVARMSRVLPPPKKEIRECLAILFVGSAKPTDDDIKRTPFLVRLQVVRTWLNWLRLNHASYTDVQLSEENLATYAEGEAPVAIVSRIRPENHPDESLAVFETENVHATDSGDCLFTVHGLDGAELVNMTLEAVVSISIRYFDSGGHALTYGHDIKPAPMNDNVLLYPDMFPWLYPYGLGGFNNDLMKTNLPLSLQIRANLFYADRRFQKDRCFPFIVFNQQQIRESSQGGYLMTTKKNFAQVAEKILSIQKDALDDLVERGKRGEYLKPTSDAEKTCFEVMNLVEHVAGHVKGAHTRKKYQRNEIKSLIIEIGVPTFFITFAPADFKNPLCLYFCGMDIDLSSIYPSLSSSNDRLRAIAQNPVGAARFFDYMVHLLITVILRHGQDRDGLFGRTEAYYGTVEEQGRKTLHLHAEIWIKASWSPQEIRDRLLADLEFEHRFIAWLEQCHTGDFQQENMESLESRLLDYYTVTSPDGTEQTKSRLKSTIRDPCTTLPHRSDHNLSSNLDDWLAHFQRDTDEVVFCSNRHDPGHGKGCWRTKPGYCKARFPRDTVEQTIVDRNSGAIRFKKMEPWINTYNPVLSYLLRCNTDVTCLLSGTQVKAVIAYVTDYVTKTNLSTYTFFDVIRTVLSRNQSVLDSTDLEKEKAARRLIMKIVNALTSGSEIGGPSVCAHLLGFPDHYTDRTFKVFYWYPYIVAAMRTLPATMRALFDLDSSPDNDKVVLAHDDAQGVVPINKVNDYIFRPCQYNDCSLFDFVQSTEIRKLTHGDCFVHGRSSFDERSPDSEKTKKDGPYELIEGHPLRASHGVFNITGPLPVLNFVGRKLPHKEKGDMNEYSLVMLALFSPHGWRNGSDLLQAGLSLMDTFTATSFKDRDVQRMKNMNLLYECLDARDDYSALRRAQQGKTDNTSTTHNHSSHLYDPTEDAVATQLHASIGNEQFEYTETSLIDFLVDAPIGRKTERNASLMGAISNVLQNTFMQPELASSSTLRNRSQMTPITVKKTAHDWKQLLKTCRETALEKRLKINNNTLCMSETTCPPISSGTYALATVNPIVRPVTIADFQNNANWKNLQTPSAGIQDSTISLVHDILNEFTLNAEQERAFVIISKHLVRHEKKPLRMYIGGMAGTGKSRVLLAVIEFLNRRDESHRFLVLGPTGGSSALIGGSTYHSVLGIGQGKGHRAGTMTSLAKLKSRLLRADLIFIDEVSMISCVDLYKINARLTQAFPESGESFGGKSVIFAGDFAQLPPPAPGSAALYSHTVGEWTPAATQNAQQQAIGKALWHQFTTVIILKQNMRQRGLSTEDVRFRTALENMRYGACTTQDIDVLTSRIRGPQRPMNCKESKRFQTVSIITARNAYRDSVNYIRVKEFASVHGKPLTVFHSIDSWKKGCSHSEDSLRKAQRSYSRVVDPIRTENSIAPEIQRMLWDLPPDLTEHIPGKLEICEGMPVLLKYNEATELCATNGASALVHSWDAHQLPSGQFVIDTLFVELVKPPQNVQLPDLPPNVIPITKKRQTIECTLPAADMKVQISRDQVHVLPNFAMTDFASQGHTRIDNVCHLALCNNHQSIYTCLSRSSSLEGTIILDDFDTKKITSGTSGALRREFRELAILDDITRLQTNDILPVNMSGTTRGELIASYWAWKGKRYVPSGVHSALDWSNAPESDLGDCLNTTQAYIGDLNQRSQTKRPKPKRPHPADAEQWSPSQAKLPRLDARSSASVYEIVHNPAQRNIETLKETERQHNTILRRYGIQWDAQNWSCGYDAVLTILWNLYSDMGPAWFMQLTPGNQLMDVVRQRFQGLDPHTGGLDETRNVIRTLLHDLQPLMFPCNGQRMVAAAEITTVLLTCVQPYSRAQSSCDACIWSNTDAPRMSDSYVWTLGDNLRTLYFPGRDVITTQEYADIMLSKGYPAVCPSCAKDIHTTTELIAPPPMLLLERTSFGVLLPQLTISLPVNLHAHIWKLRAVIYCNNSHFVCRYIDNNWNVWYHDGASTGRYCTLQNVPISPTNMNVMMSCNSYQAAQFIYVLDDHIPH